MADISTPISAYIYAKDGNRPWLMPQAFAKDANLEMVVQTDAISFPSAATGIDAITKILASQFSCDYENVFTLCLCSPPKGYYPKFSCNWLVGMSSRENRVVRVGCGRYDWLFSNPENLRANELKITIQAMEILVPESLQPVMSWLSRLPYPWCSTEAAIEGFPELDELRTIWDFLIQQK